MQGLNNFKHEEWRLLGCYAILHNFKHVIKNPVHNNKVVHYCHNFVFFVFW
jgi:hypothetical protein